MTNQEQYDNIWNKADKYDKLIKVLDEIKAEIDTPNRGSYDYYIVDRIEEIINRYKVESEVKE